MHANSTDGDMSVDVLFENLPPGFSLRRCCRVSISGGVRVQRPQHPASLDNALALCNAGEYVVREARICHRDEHFLMLGGRLRMRGRSATPAYRSAVQPPGY